MPPNVRHKIDATKKINCKTVPICVVDQRETILKRINKSEEHQKLICPCVFKHNIFASFKKVIPIGSKRRGREFPGWRGNVDHIGADRSASAIRCRPKGA